MSECMYCHTALPAGAAFCASCGKSQSDPSVTRPLINPEAQRAYVATAQAAQGLVSALGVEKTLCIVGGALAVFGCLLPAFSIGGLQPDQQATMAVIGPLNLLRFGAPAFVVLLLSIFLGLALVVFRPSRAIAIAGVGLCAIVLTELFNYWFIISGAQTAIAMAFSAAHVFAPTAMQYGNDALSPLGTVVFGPGVGFYLLILGYGILFYTYARTAGQ